MCIFHAGIVRNAWAQFKGCQHSDLAAHDERRHGQIRRVGQPRSPRAQHPLRYSLATSPAVYHLLFKALTARPPLQQATVSEELVEITRTTIHVPLVAYHRPTRTSSKNVSRARSPLRRQRVESKLYPASRAGVNACCMLRTRRGGGSGGDFRPIRDPGRACLTCRLTCTRIRPYKMRQCDR